MLTLLVERPGGMLASIRSVPQYVWATWIAVAFIASAIYLGLYLDSDAGDSLETARYLVESNIWSADRQLTVDDHSNHFLWVVAISILAKLSGIGALWISYGISAVCLGAMYLLLIKFVQIRYVLLYIALSSLLYLAWISYAVIPYALLWTAFAIVLLRHPRSAWIIALSVLLVMFRIESIVPVGLALTIYCWKHKYYSGYLLVGLAIAAYLGLRLLYFGELFGDSGTAGYYFEKALSLRGAMIYALGLGGVLLLVTTQRLYWALLVLGTTIVAVGAPEGPLQISRYYLPLTASALIFASYTLRPKLILFVVGAIFWTALTTQTTANQVWAVIDYRQELSEMVSDYNGLGGTINEVGAEWIYNAPDWNRSRLSLAEEFIDVEDPRLEDIDLLIILCNHKTRCSKEYPGYESNWVLYDPCGESIRAYIRTESDIASDLATALDSPYWDTWYDMDTYGPAKGC